LFVNPVCLFVKWKSGFYKNFFRCTVDIGLLFTDYHNLMH